MTLKARARKKVVAECGSYTIEINGSHINSVESDNLPTLNVYEKPLKLGVM